jgi:hypothetical protein
MERSIKIFRSFDEQEQYNLEQARSTTPLQRFQKLYEMQEFTRRFHPSNDKTRKIVIRKWIS